MVKICLILNIRMEKEKCSLLNTFCLFSTEISKMFMRELTHAGVKSASVNSRRNLHKDLH